MALHPAGLQHSPTSPRWNVFAITHGSPSYTSTSEDASILGSPCPRHPNSLQSDERLASPLVSRAPYVPRYARRLLSRAAQESADRPAPGQNVKQPGALLPESTQWGGHSPRHGIYRCHNLALVAVSGHSAEQSCSQDGAETGGAS